MEILIVFVLNDYIFFLVFHMGGTTCATMCMHVEVRGQLTGLASLLPTYGQALGMEFRSSGVAATMFTDYTTLCWLYLYCFYCTYKVSNIDLCNSTQYLGLQVNTTMPETCII